MNVIAVKNLTKYYRVHQKEAGLKGSVKSLFDRKYFDAKAVDDISFEIQEGELIGFIGPNGAGKTTTLKCLSGLLYPTNGNVEVLGFTPFDRDYKFLKQISLVMGQKNQLWWDLPASDSFLLNKEIYEIDDQKYKKTLGELIDLLDARDILNVQVRKLSLGQRMKCELIASLIHQPKILFLDEPTIGLDVVMQQKLRNFVKEYNKKFNATILLTSHYMKDVEELCKRIIIIDNGKILYDGALSEIVKKHTTHKLLRIVFRKEIDKKELSKLGNVEEITGTQVTLSVDRRRSNEVAANILKKYQIEDFNIEEPAIEDIIQEVFTKKEK